MRASNGLIASWHAVIGYSLQLYFDFSGYSDMAIGLARMFNIRFPLNFNSPYKATTVIDYWQRFHMTLTRFITMYIFSPIALWVTRWRDRHGFDNSRRASATPGGFVSLVAGPTLITMALAGSMARRGHAIPDLRLASRTLHHGEPCRAHLLSGAEEAAGPKPWFACRPRTMSAKVLAVYIAALVAFAFFRAPSSRGGDASAGRDDRPARDRRGAAAKATAGSACGVLFAIVWFAPNTQQIMNALRACARPRRWPIPIGG